MVPEIWGPHAKRKNSHWDGSQRNGKHLLDETYPSRFKSSIHLYNTRNFTPFLKIEAFFSKPCESQVETENLCWYLVICRFCEVMWIKFGWSGPTPNRLVEPTGLRLVHSIISSCWVDMGRAHSLADEWGRWMGHVNGADEWDSEWGRSDGPPSEWPRTYATLTIPF